MMRYLNLQTALLGETESILWHGAFVMCLKESSSKYGCISFPVAAANMGAYPSFPVETVLHWPRFKSETIFLLPDKNAAQWQSISKADL